MDDRRKMRLKQLSGLVVGVGIGILLLNLFGGGRKPEWFDRPVREGVDVSYSGRYREEPRFKALARDAARLRREALVAVTNRTGLEIKEADRLVLSFRDGGHGFLQKAVSRAVRSPTGYLQLTEIGLDRYMAGSLRLEDTLVHEFTHSVMRQRMERRYRQTPLWFREGVAVWAAEQVDFKMISAVANSLYYRSDPDQLFDGLNEEPTGDMSYLDEGFFFEYLERTFGAEAVRRIIARVVAGEDVDEAIEDETGAELSALEEEAHAHGLKRVHDLLAEGGGAEMRAAIERSCAGDRWGAMEELRSFLREHSSSFLAPLAQLELATCLSIVGRPSEALGWVDDAQGTGPVYPWLATKLRYRRARIHLSSGQYGDAQRELGEIIRMHVWEGEWRLAAIRVDWAEALVGAGSPGEAIRAVDEALPLLVPASSQRALESKADALERLGQSDGSARTGELQLPVVAQKALIIKADALERLGRSDESARTRALQKACVPASDLIPQYRIAEDPRVIESLARSCVFDSDCRVVELPRCESSCRPGPCGAVVRG